MNRRGFLGAVGALLAERVVAQTQGAQAWQNEAPIKDAFGGPSVNARDLGNGRGEAVLIMPDRKFEVQYNGPRMSIRATYRDFRNNRDFVFTGDFQRYAVEDRGPFEPPAPRYTYKWAKNVDKVARDLATQNPSLGAMPKQELGLLAETVALDMAYAAKHANDAYFRVNWSNPYGNPGYVVEFQGIPHCAPVRGLDHWFGSGNQGPMKFMDPEYRPYCPPTPPATPFGYGAPIRPADSFGAPPIPRYGQQ